jgi:hypothetical protein
MIRRRNPRLGDDVAAVGLLVVGVVGVVGLVITVWTAFLARVRVQRTRSSGLSGGPCSRARVKSGLGWLRVSRGGNMRHLLHACTSVDRLVDYLLDRAVDKLPAAASARFAEEWRDHRQHYSGWRLVWWALCVRATAMRTVTALEPARLSRDS